MALVLTVRTTSRGHTNLLLHLCVLGIAPRPALSRMDGRHRPARRLVFVLHRLGPIFGSMALGITVTPARRAVMPVHQALPWRACCRRVAQPRNDNIFATIHRRTSWNET